MRQNWRRRLEDLLHDKPPSSELQSGAKDPNALLIAASIHAKDKLVLVYLRDARHEIHVHDLITGRPLRRILRDLVGQFMVTGRRVDKDMFIFYSGFTSPGTVYRYRFDDERDMCSLFRTIRIPGLDLDKFVTESVFYPSKDGISNAPDILRLYDIVLQDLSSDQSLSGGSEYYGESWHRAGMLGNKQNVFNDLNAATEWLVANKYANKDHIAIHGGSNGGVLTTACANQAPGLYRCVITIGGIIDMLRVC
ncbi:hypothetical protein K435DRAFT_875474 [Dendrothele bispora CBS 962.96]|uniref:Prolyl endopeptidase n=1 Tax=Dendrothele bispora (strain CBS 962.96) TaxID=1314807 RepID=A0A4S8KU98_DENBC|nr:hypothetical protein K435DRAFT_875474 [Dendrothele bispora CBS 962.96]